MGRAGGRPRATQKTSSRTSRWSVCAVGSLTFAAALLGAVLSPAAHAASFTVWSCADGQGKPLSAGDFSPSTLGTQSLATSTCGANVTGSTPGNLQAASGGGPGQQDGGAGGWLVRAAPDTTISGLDVWWTNSASLQLPGRVSVITNTGALYGRDAGSFGNVTLPFEDGNRQTFTGLTASTVGLIASCVSGCNRADRAISAVLNAYRVKVTVSDTTAPTGEVNAPANGTPIPGPVTLQARASDVGGGIRDIQLVVDGRVVASKEAGGGCSDIDPATGDANDYTSMHPCPGQLPATPEPPTTFILTPQMLATAGAHTVEIVAHDAAGNTGTLLSQTMFVASVLLDGPAPASRYDAGRNLFFNPDADPTRLGRPNGLNAGPANVSLSFVVKRTRRAKGKLQRVTTFTRRRTVGYNTVTRIRGRVTTLTGAPIVAARVYRATSVAGGPWRLITKPLLTSKTGRVSVKLAARSPSRRVVLVYFPSTDSNASARSKTRLLRVRAPVSLGLSRRNVPRGSRVNITARLRAGMRPGATVLGALQLRQGRSWRTIRQMRFTSRGRGVARTALRLRTPSVYRLRLRISAQPGVRYTTGVSRQRVLRVR